MVRKFPANVFQEIWKKNEIRKANHSNQNSTEEEINFTTIIPGKKFQKIWIASQGCPWALSIRPKFSKSWYGNFRRKCPENPEIVEIPRSEPFNRKFWKFRDENRVERKISRKLGMPHEIVLFFGILQICHLLFSASLFGRDHSELNI